jgi:hypothetical protein
LDEWLISGEMAALQCCLFSIPTSHIQPTSVPSRIACCSCEGANKGGVLTGEMRRNPHVQSYVVATDQVGGWVGGWGLSWVMADAEGRHQSPGI